MSVDTYTISKATSILNDVLSAFSLNSSIRDVSMLVGPSASTTSSPTSSDGIMKYVLNNMMLSITLVLLWMVSVAFILQRGRFGCCLGRSYERIKEGATDSILGDDLSALGDEDDFTIDDDDDNDDNDGNDKKNVEEEGQRQEQKQNQEKEDQKPKSHERQTIQKLFQLVTVASDNKELIRGTTEDQINYEILCAQMVRVRNFFKLLVLLTVITSVPTLLVTLYLKNSHHQIMRETKSMTARLHGAAEAVNSISADRVELMALNIDLASSLQSQSLQNCFNSDEILIGAASDFSSSLFDMNEALGATNMQDLEDIYKDAQEFSSYVEKDIGIYSLALSFLISSVSALDVVSLVLFVVTVMATRNDKRKSVPKLFKTFYFPFLVLSSSMMLFGATVFIMIGYVSVDFCATMGSPTNAILSILDRKGYNSTEFFSVAKDVMSNECVNDNAVFSLLWNIESSVSNGVAFNSFLPQNFENSCPEYTSFSQTMNEFYDITDAIKPTSQDQTIVFQCDDIEDWYSNLSFGKTCTDIPKYLSFTILCTCMLILFSIMMISTRIAWRTNIDLFKEIYNEVERSQIRKLGVQGMTRKKGKRSKLKNFQSHRLSVVQRGLGFDDMERGSYLDSISYQNDGTGAEISNYQTELAMFDNSESGDKRNEDDSSVLADALKLAELEAMESSQRIVDLEEYMESLQHEAFLKNMARQNRLQQSTEELNHPQIDYAYGNQQYNGKQQYLNYNPHIQMQPGYIPQEYTSPSRLSHLEDNDSEKDGTSDEESSKYIKKSSRRKKKAKQRSGGRSWNPMLMSYFK